MQAFLSPQASNPTPIGSSAVDVSSGAAACGGTSGARTCTILIPAAIGTVDFVITTYDQAPLSGTFASSAHILSTGRITQTIEINQTNVVNISLGGVIAALQILPQAGSLPAGTSGVYQLAVVARDAEGYTIVAGSADPYYNPITVTVTEFAGTGNCTIKLGGPNATLANVVTLNQSTDQASISYNGRGAPGYYVKITAAAQGATPAVATFNPFFVTAVNSGSGTVSYSGLNASATLTLSEVGLTGPFSAAPSASCANVINVGHLSPIIGGVSTLEITSVGVGSCVVTFSDGTSIVPVTFAVPASSTITITIPKDRDD